MQLGKKHIWTAAIGAVVLATAGTTVGLKLFRKAPSVPTGEVRRGEFVDFLQLRGEVKAVKSGLIMAPTDSDNLVILKLVANGARVKKGDVVVQFDPTPLQRSRDQKLTDLRTAEAEIQRTVAQKNLDNEQRRTDMLAARYNVERAKLDASKQEILSEIDGEKTKLSLANAEQKLVEVQQRVKAGDVFTEADLSSRRRRRDKALADLRRVENQIAHLTVRAPLDGLVTILPSSRWGNAQEFKPGDQPWPGAVIAEMPELSSFRLTTHVDETERRRLTLQQSALVRVDALADTEIPASVAQISTLARPDYSMVPPPKNFDIEMELKGGDSRLRPGMSANARIVVDRVPDSILVPTEALFQKQGRTVIYVLKHGGFEERTVQVARRGMADAIVISGVAPGEKIALKDPTQDSQEKQ